MAGNNYKGNHDRGEVVSENGYEGELEQMECSSEGDDKDDNVGGIKALSWKVRLQIAKTEEVGL